MDMSKFYGVMTASVTPVCADGSLDTASVAALMDYYAENEITGEADAYLEALPSAHSFSSSSFCLTRVISASRSFNS